MQEVSSSAHAPGIMRIYSLFNLTDENSTAKFIGKYMTRMFTNAEMKVFISHLKGIGVKADEGTSNIYIY